MAEIKLTHPAFTQSGFYPSRERFKRVLQYLNQNLQLGGKAVLDVGCGQGYYLDLFMKQGASAAWGVDVSPKNISAARQLFPSISFIEGDYMTAVLPGKADLLFSESAVHYFPENLTVVLGKFFCDLEDRGEIFITHARWTLKNIFVLNFKRVLSWVENFFGGDVLLYFACALYGKKHSRDFLRQQMTYLKCRPRLLTKKSFGSALRAAGFQMIRMGNIPSNSFFQTDHCYIYARKRF